MPKNGSDNDKYWDMRRKEQLTQSYKKYLEEENLSSGPDSAHLFALKEKKDGNNHGLSERETILHLAGELPYLYD